MAKKLPFGPDLGSLGPNSGCQFFFFQKSDFVSTRYHVQLSSRTISEKSKDPILKKSSDGWTHRETEESDFIGCCPTNAKRPISGISTLF